uniref:Protein kinase domain-containing protein n=1 Tax=Caenorhabditis tropicalis TaxID=1561998 RepID=A0A1I7TL41_9PELO
MCKRTCPNADTNSSEAREPSPKRSRPDPSGESGSNPAAPSTSTDIAEPLSTDSPQLTSDQGSTQSGLSMKSYKLEATPMDSISENSYDKGGLPRIEPGKVLNDEYTVLRFLGRGTYSSIWLSKKNDSGEYNAIKVTKSAYKYRKAAKREIEVMIFVQKEVQHKNIVKYLGNFEILDNEMKHHALRLEVLGPSMEDVFDRSQPKFHPNVLKSMIRQVLEAVKYIHGINIVHMDIKPNNIMIVISEENIQEIANSENIIINNYRMDLTSANSKITVKLADFGIAFDKGLSVHHPRPTCTYRAPESFLTRTIDFPIDMWSMGCTIHKIVTRRSVLNCDQKEGHEQTHLPNMAETLGPILGALFPNSQRPEYNDYFGVKDCIDCGTPDVHENFVRAASKYLNQEDAQSFSEFMQLCLKYNPNERLTAAEALDHKFLSLNETDSVHENEIPPHPTEPSDGQPAASQTSSADGDTSIGKEPSTSCK